MKVVRLSALRTGSLYPPPPSGNHLALISVRGWVNSTVQPEGLRQWKIPSTPSGMEPATCWLVARCLNQLLHRVHSPGYIVFINLRFVISLSYNMFYLSSIALKFLHVRGLNLKISTNIYNVYKIRGSCSLSNLVSFTFRSCPADISTYKDMYSDLSVAQS